MQNKGKERKRKLLSLIMVLLLTAFMLLACTDQQTNESSNNGQSQQTVEKNQSKDQNSVNQDSDDTNNEVESKASSEKVVSIMDIPAYDGKSYATINGNEPAFTNKEKKNTSSFEQYGSLDSLGRCSTCFANVGQDLMPSEKRGSIGQVKPTGWYTIKYDNVDGKYLYNRSH